MENNIHEKNTNLDRSIEYNEDQYMMECNDKYYLCRFRKDRNRREKEEVVEEEMRVAEGKEEENN